MSNGKTSRSIIGIVVSIALLALMSVSLTSCGKGNEKKLLRALNAYTVSSQTKIITDQQFAVLEGMLAKCKKGVTINNVEITDSESLAAYIISTGITESAAALKNSDNSANFAQLNIILETSASMKGYSNTGNADFAKPIIAMFRSVDPSKTNIITSFAHGTPKSKDDACMLDTVNVDKFKDDIAYGRILEDKSSPLDKILGSIAENATDSTVSVLITDGIISGTNPEIVKNREFSIDHQPWIQDRVRKAMEVAKSKGQAFEIYCFETPFTGKYFDYRNNDGNQRKHMYKSVARPYYMIVIGPEGKVSDMHEKLLAESGFKPIQELNSYNSSNLPQITSGTISPSPMPGVPQPKVAITPSQMKFPKSISSLYTFKYHFVFPQEMPAEFVNADLIKDSIKISYVDPASNMTVDAKKAMLVDVRPSSGPNSFDIDMQITPEFVNAIPKSRVINITVPVAMNSWYMDMSIDNDNVDPYVNEHKTFALKSLIEAFKQGYELKDTANIVDINLTICK